MELHRKDSAVGGGLNALAVGADDMQAGLCAVCQILPQWIPRSCARCLLAFHPCCAQLHWNMAEVSLHDHS